MMEEMNDFKPESENNYQLIPLKILAYIMIQSKNFNFAREIRYIQVFHYFPSQVEYGYNSDE